MPLVAMARIHEGRALIVAVPRLAGRLTRDGSWPLGAVWSGTHLVLPADVPGCRWHDRLSSRIVDTQSSTGARVLPLDALFSVMPGVWLEAADSQV
jgi:maltooligosyltrehalose synthase